MKLTAKFLIVMAAITASTSVPLRSEARDLHVTASIGQPVRVFGHVRLNDDCGPGDLPDMTIVAPPQLGEVTTKVETVTLTARDFGTCANGGSAPGTVVYYTARQGGYDSFHYQMSSQGKPTTDWVVTVDTP
jgi:hypothetical protein